LGIKTPAATTTNNTSPLTTNVSIIMGKEVSPAVAAGLSKQAGLGLALGIVFALGWRVYYKNTLSAQTLPPWDANTARAVQGLPTPAEFFKKSSFLFEDEENSE